MTANQKGLEICSFLNYKLCAICNACVLSGMSCVIVFVCDGRNFYVCDAISQQSLAQSQPLASNTSVYFPYTTSQLKAKAFLGPSPFTAG